MKNSAENESWGRHYRRIRRGGGVRRRFLEREPGQWIGSFGGRLMRARHDLVCGRNSAAAAHEIDGWIRVASLGSGAKLVTTSWIEPMERAPARRRARMACPARHRNTRVGVAQSKKKRTKWDKKTGAEKEERKKRRATDRARLSCDPRVSLEIKTRDQETGPKQPKAEASLQSTVTWQRQQRVCVCVCMRVLIRYGFILVDDRAVVVEDSRRPVLRWPHRPGSSIFLFVSFVVLCCCGGGVVSSAWCCCKGRRAFIIMGNCTGKAKSFNELNYSALDRVTSRTSSEDDCLLYRLADYQRGGELVNFFQKEGVRSTEELLREQIPLLLYQQGQGRVVTRSDYLKWKYRNQPHVSSPKRKNPPAAVAATVVDRYRRSWWRRLFYWARKRLYGVFVAWIEFSSGSDTAAIS